MLSDQSVPTSTATRLPLVIYVLATGTFLMGTTEFMIAGLLPEIATSLRSRSRTRVCSSPSSRSG